MAQKRRRAGIATRQERGSKSNPRRSESAEKTRSFSRPSAHKQSNVPQAINSPVALKFGKRAALNSGDTDPNGDQLLISSMLTKSLGIPNTGSLPQNAAKKQRQEGLFKILKDFEEQLETGYHVDQSLNRSVSMKRDRSTGAKSKQIFAIQ